MRMRLQKERRRVNILSVILIAAILVVLAALGYIVATPYKGKPFTEFYMLGSGGRAEGYPRALRVGEKAGVTLGIVNREHGQLSYRVEVRINGVTDNKAGPIVLASGQKWEEIVSFTPDSAGNNQKVEFFLYKDRETGPSLQPLYLWINVTE